MEISKNFLILSVIVALLIAFIVSVVFGQTTFAGVAIGALAGWIGGNYNGARAAAGTI